MKEFFAKITVADLEHPALFSKPKEALVCLALGTLGATAQFPLQYDDQSQVVAALVERTGLGRTTVYDCLKRLREAGVYTFQGGRPRLSFSPHLRTEDETESAPADCQSVPADSESAPADFAPTLTRGDAPPRDRENLGESLAREAAPPRRDDGAHPLLDRHNAFDGQWQRNTQPARCHDCGETLHELDGYRLRTIDGSLVYTHQIDGSCKPEARVIHMRVFEASPDPHPVTLEDLARAVGEAKEARVFGT